MTNLLKNVANQWVTFVMKDGTTLKPVAGITLANITVRLSQINVGVSNPSALATATNNASIVEIGNGSYAIKLTQAETNCDSLLVVAVYSTTAYFNEAIQHTTQVNVGALSSSALTQIENQVWDALRASHVVSNSFGEGTLIAPNSTVSITQLNGSSAAATNMAAFFTTSVGCHLPKSSVGNTVNGVVSAAGSTTITLDANADATTNDIYKNQMIRISDGVGVGQTRIIVSYDASTKVATVQPAWLVNPVSGSIYSISGAAQTGYFSNDALTQIENQVWNAVVSAHPTPGTFGAGVMLDPDAFVNVALSFPVSSGPAQDINQAISMTYQRFFGQLVTDNNAKTLIVKSNDGSKVISTQYWTNPTSYIISLGSAS